MSEHETQSAATTEIVNGIEWYGENGEDCQCARCGSSAGWNDCANCSSDGFVEHDSWDGCGEGYEVRCDWCGGTGGSWHCVSSPEWCNAHPMPGREHIESTAMNAEAWND